MKGHKSERDWHPPTPSIKHRISISLYKRGKDSRRSKPLRFRHGRTAEGFCPTHAVGNPFLTADNNGSRRSKPLRFRRGRTAEGFCPTHATKTTRLCILAVCLVLSALIVSCGDSKPVDPDPVYDTIPPARYHRSRCRGYLHYNGDSRLDRSSGMTVLQDEQHHMMFATRFSKSPIQTGCHQSNARVSHPRKNPGEIDTFTVTGLEPATTYYFAVKDYR